MFLHFDPGFNQLLIAVAVMVGVAVTVGSVYVFVQVTHAMWIGPPTGAILKPAALAALSAQHHGETLLAMLVGGLLGLLSALTVADASPRQLGLTMVLAPIPMLATMALAIAFAGHRTAGIAVMAIVMGIGTWLPKLTPRIGARAFFFGQMAVRRLSAGLSQSRRDPGWPAGSDRGDPVVCGCGHLRDQDVDLRPAEPWCAAAHAARVLRAFAWGDRVSGRTVRRRF